MLINMQTKFVYVMFYNSVLNSYVVNFIILQSQGEKKLLCICHMFKWERVHSFEFEMWAFWMVER